MFVLHFFPYKFAALPSVACRPFAPSWALNVLLIKLNIWFPSCLDDCVYFQSVVQHSERSELEMTISEKLQVNGRMLKKSWLVCVTRVSTHCYSSWNHSLKQQFNLRHSFQDSQSHATGTWFLAYCQFHLGMKSAGMHQEYVYAIGPLLIHLNWFKIHLNWFDSYLCCNPK